MDFAYINEGLIFSAIYFASWRRECQSIPIDAQAVFHLSTWAPTVLATIDWLIRALAALKPLGRMA
jgi:hypothetical protein